MFQDFALFPHLTVLQNVLFGLRQLGRSAALAQARAALRRVGLADREADYPHMLSGGQQQRLALARSVAPRPGVLLLDEPFSSLDARLRETVREETLAVLRETHVTSLIVTHDPEEAMVLGDRVALLRQGRIAQIGTGRGNLPPARRSQRRPLLFPLSEIDGIVAGGHAATPLGHVAAPGLADGTRVTVAIRPPAAPASAVAARARQAASPASATPSALISARSRSMASTCPWAFGSLPMRRHGRGTGRLRDAQSRNTFLCLHAIEPISDLSFACNAF